MVDAEPLRSPDPVARRVIEVLEGLGADFEALPCDPDLADTAAFCRHYGVAPEDSANTILVASRDQPRRHAACVLLATTRLDVNGTVRRRLGARKASFAPAAETVALTGMLVGGVTPFALPEGLPVWVDERVLQRPRVVLGGGSRSLKVRLAPSVLTLLATTEVVDGLARPA